MDKIILTQCTGFDWDEANRNKNQEKHEVSYWEAEQVFFNEPLMLCEDVGHSQQEQRLYVLGRTDSNRKLFIVFTVRNGLIRVISARDVSKKERGIYEKA